MKRILKWVASLALTVAVAGTTFLPAMTANAAEAEGTEKVQLAGCVAGGSVREKAVFTVNRIDTLG